MGYLGLCMSVCDGLCTHAEMRRIKYWPVFLNHTSSPWLTEGAGLHTVQKKTKYIFSWQWRHNFKWGKRRGGCRKLRIMEAKYYSWLFLGKCLVFLCEGNYVYVDNGNIIIPPEHIVCCSERHVWELSNELLSFFSFFYQDIHRKKTYWQNAALSNILTPYRIEYFVTWTEIQECN